MLSGEGGEAKLREVRRAAEGGVFSGGRVPGQKKNGFIRFKRLANSPQGSGSFPVQNQRKITKIAKNREKSQKS